jgi:hypothetical protein
MRAPLTAVTEGTVLLVDIMGGASIEHPIELDTASRTWR